MKNFSITILLLALLLLAFAGGKLSAQNYTVLIENASFPYTGLTLSAVDSLICGTNVTFESGCDMNLHAGKAVIFLPGTHIELGTKLHAYIEDTSSKAPSSGESSTVYEDLQLSTYPNPSQGEVHLKAVSGLAGTLNCTVHNLQGKVIWQEKAWIRPGESTETLHLPPGLYILRAEIQGRVKTSRILVI